MAIACWRVLGHPRSDPVRRLTLRWHLTQLAFNAAWSVVFFAWHSLGWALLDIAALLASIIQTLRYAARVDRLAGLLLVPYLAWVTFASALNAGVWWLNR